jgi:hypothetical protein
MAPEEACSAVGIAGRMLLGLVGVLAAGLYWMTVREGEFPWSAVVWWVIWPAGFDGWCEDRVAPSGSTRIRAAGTTGSGAALGLRRTTAEPIFGGRPGVVPCVVPILVPGLVRMSRRRGAIGSAPDL